MTGMPCLRHFPSIRRIGVRVVVETVEMKVSIMRLVCVVTFFAIPVATVIDGVIWIPWVGAVSRFQNSAAERRGR